MLVACISACKKEKFVETVSVCPLVLTANPANGSLNVPLNQLLQVTFNEEMNPTTINTSSITLESASVLVPGKVTYSGVVAEFTPNAPLVANTTYMGRVKTSVKDLLGNALQVEYTWTFSTGALMAPLVIKTNPINNDSNIPLMQDVEAFFNLPMDSASINNNTFTLYNGLTKVPGNVSYNGTKAIFNPTVDYATNTVYTATITKGAKSKAGTPMVADYIWTFKTEPPLSPRVIKTDPRNNEIKVAVDKTVTADFSEVMIAGTLNANTFTIKEGVNLISGTISYNGTRVTFNPTNDFKLNTDYICTITTGAKNLAGTSIARDYVWTFTTVGPVPPMVISTNPADLEKNVVLNKVITATFSEAMDASSIDATTFTLKYGVNIVQGTVTYNNTVATFTPTNNLLSGNVYTATIYRTVKNLAGTLMVADYTWTFSTKDPLGPKAPDLKTVARFGIIAGAGISNNAGFSKINNMDVGISPGARSSITGFPPATVNNGALYAADDAAPVPAMLTQAKLDLTTAYLFAEAATTPAPTTVSGDQGGKTLAPGIYKSTSTLLVQSGDLTLDAKGDVNAVWIFQVASGFTTVGGAGGNIILTGGAQAKNIYWQTGSSAVIGDNTAFYGNILALTSITLNSNATVTGRVLCSNGSVVLTSTNIINKP